MRSFVAARAQRLLSSVAEAIHPIRLLQVEDAFTASQHYSGLLPMRTRPDSQIPLRGFDVKAH